MLRQIHIDNPIFKWYNFHRIHTSQKEIESGEGYTIFEYRLRPSFDFVQHLLWNKKVEVLSPLSLREEMKKELEEMLGRYK